MLRRWKLVNGSFSCTYTRHLKKCPWAYRSAVTPHVKATLNLSYDFLRLYINAFAFQATLNRAVDRARQSSSSSAVRGALFPNVAGSPDARFIYESIDAASSLLETLNSYIDPVSGLRYMPLKYYLYVIYAAVFLYKVSTQELCEQEGCLITCSGTNIRCFVYRSLRRRPPQYQSYDRSPSTLSNWSQQPRSSLCSPSLSPLAQITRTK